jgi:prevent-host-death family protein
MVSSLEAHESEGSRGEETESSVGAYEVKTHLAELLDRVERGETITITRHGKPIAKLVPASGGVARPDARKAVEEMKRFRDEHGPILGPGRTIRDLIEEGRRF